MSKHTELQGTSTMTNNKQNKDPDSMNELKYLDKELGIWRERSVGEVGVFTDVPR